MYISTNVSQYFKDSLNKVPLEVEICEPAPQYNIFLHTQKPNRFIKLDEDWTKPAIETKDVSEQEAERYIDTLIGHYARINMVSIDGLALTNALWYSLSDYFDVFPDNLSLATLSQLIALGDYLIKESVKADFNPEFILNPYDGGGNYQSKHYRSFMYFRDYPFVCHPLIEYRYKKKWSILRYRELLDEVEMTKVRWMNKLPDGKTLL